MGKSFDIGLERLAGVDVTVRGDIVPPSSSPAFRVPISSRDETFYLETFGCQMNEHDSEKVAGVLLARGYKQVETPEAAKVILYNTCSIREKAAQKVFSRLGELRPAEERAGGPVSAVLTAIAGGNPRKMVNAGGGKIIGVLGCVAQQEGEEIFERARWVQEISSINQRLSDE